MKKIFLSSCIFLFAFLSCSRHEVLEVKDAGAVGAAARHLLSDEKYRSLRVEISYMPGFEPDALVTGQLHDFLTTYLNKPDGITIEKKQIPATPEFLLTLAEVEGIEKSYRKAYSSGNQIAIHIMIVDAKYNQQSILALAYRSTSICIFGKTVAQHTSDASPSDRSQLCVNLMKHETGHLLGLVNKGTPMHSPHQDPISSSHCNNASCLMNYALEFSCLRDVPVPQLDSDCRQDLVNNGGRMNSR